MSKHFSRLPLATVAAIIVAALGATSVLAATTWTVTPGGKITVNSGGVGLKDARTGASVKCKSLTIKATLKSGSGLSGAGIGTITSLAFGTCTGPVGLMFTLSNSLLPYAINAISYNSAAGITTATIAGIHGTFTGPGCSYVLDGTGPGKDNGTLAFTYTNSTHWLKLLRTGGNLHAYKVSGCSTVGGIHSSDPMTLSGTGTVTPAQTITSP